MLKQFEKYKNVEERRKSILVETVMEAVVKIWYVSF